jgi:uncharacterized protein
VIVVDTAVLVYAVGGEHPLREPALRLFEAVSDGRLAATTSTEVIQEFVHVRARRRPRSEAVARARSFAALLGPLMPADEDILRRGLAIFAASDRLGGFDSVLAALALDRDAALVSSDRAFAAVPGLRHVDPADPDFLDHLGVG